MELENSCEPAEAGGAALVPPLEVMILYEDIGTALRAKGSLGSLTSAGVPGSTPRLWKLSLLADPLLQEQAAIEAAAADVILVSIHGRQSLGPEMWEWMRRWRDHRAGQPCAFGLLLDSEPDAGDASHPVLACVRRLAEAAGADFFFGSGRTPAGFHETTPWSPVVIENLLGRAYPPSHWGINE